MGLVTNTGVASFVDAVIAENTMRYLGWGGGSGQDVSSTDLATAFAEARTAGTLTAVTTNTADDTLRITGTLAASAAQSVTEVGVFSALTGAVMQIYGDFTEVLLGSGDTIAFTIDVVVDQA